MRPHQDSLLAMRVSAALMSVSAALLVIMLLTGDAQAKAIAKAQYEREAARAAISVSTQVAPTATPPGLPALKTQAISATHPVTSTSTTAKVTVRVRPKVASGSADLPAMPVLGAIADVPAVNIQPRQASAPAQSAAQPQPKVVTKTS